LLDGDGQGPGQDPVMAQHGGGGRAAVQQRRVELIEVLGPQAVEAVTTDAWDEVPADG